LYPPLPGRFVVYGHPGKVVKPGLHVSDARGAIRIRATIQQVNVMTLGEKAQQFLQPRHLRLAASLAAFRTPARRTAGALDQLRPALRALTRGILHCVGFSLVSIFPQDNSSIRGDTLQHRGIGGITYQPATVCLRRSEAVFWGFQSRWRT
jgi:hypothetical protein